MPTSDTQTQPDKRDSNEIPFEEWVVAPAGLRIDEGTLLSIYPSPRYQQKLNKGEVIVTDIVANYPAHLTHR